MLLTASYATIAASTEDDIEHINQADQAITAITLPPVQQALLNTEKIGYQFGHKPIGDGVPFASPYPYRYDSGFSNDCVAFDGNVTMQAMGRMQIQV